MTTTPTAFEKQTISCQQLLGITPTEPATHPLTARFFSYRQTQIGCQHTPPTQTQQATRNAFIDLLEHSTILNLANPNPPPMETADDFLESGKQAGLMVLLIPLHYLKVIGLLLARLLFSLVGPAVVAITAVQTAFADKNKPGSFFEKLMNRLRPWRQWVVSLSDGRAINPSQQSKSKQPNRLIALFASLFPIIIPIITLLQVKKISLAKRILLIVWACIGQPICCVFSWLFQCLRLLGLSLVVWPFHYYSKNLDQLAIPLTGLGVVLSALHFAALLPGPLHKPLHTIDLMGKLLTPLHLQQSNEIGLILSVLSFLLFAAIFLGHYRMSKQLTSTPLALFKEESTDSFKTRLQQIKQQNKPGLLWKPIAIFAVVTALACLSLWLIDTRLPHNLVTSLLLGLIPVTLMVTLFVMGILYTTPQTARYKWLGIPASLLNQSQSYVRLRESSQINPSSSATPILHHDR